MINAMNNVIRIIIVGEIRRAVISFMKKAIIFINITVINNANVIIIIIKYLFKECIFLPLLPL